MNECPFVHLCRLYDKGSYYCFQERGESFQLCSLYAEAIYNLEKKLLIKKEFCKPSSAK